MATLSAVPREIYRSMDDDPDGRPRCGSDDNQLGARVPQDVQPDADDNVHPLRGGMSATADHPKHLPPHVRPRQFGGRGGLPVFVLHASEFGDGFALRYKKKHVLVEPGAVVPLSIYQGSLCKTRLLWRLWTP